MSEYQYVAFRAVDGPVSEKHLEFMRRQSSRAEITPWFFDNEYHYGDFRGDAVEMLRRGYDLHLHYANFGVRKLLIRLPQGLPDADAAAPYFGKDSLEFLKDKRGPGGVLVISPYLEAGELEDLWDVSEILGRLVSLRAEILDGDLRPLYLAHLAMACDGNHDPEDAREGPVPAGLDKLTDAQRALAELYGLSKGLIGAAARQCPALPTAGNHQKQLVDWLLNQSEAKKNAWLAQLLTVPHSTTRREILAEFQKSQGEASWPTIPLNRSIVELKGAATEIQRQPNEKAAIKAVTALGKSPSRRKNKRG